MHASLLLRSSCPVIFIQAALHLLLCCPESPMSSSGSGVAFEPGFRDQWQRLISENLWTALVHLGVEDASELAYLFSSQDEAREWAVLQQCGADSDRFQKVTCMNFQQALSYSDTVLRRSVEVPEPLQLTWLSRNDHLTRTGYRTSCKVGHLRGVGEGPDKHGRVGGYP